jgi:ferritin-like metal-binding protein YciE
LRDILHAEKQVLKALPKMVKAAHSQQLQQLFETHLKETQTQIERLDECFSVLDIQPRAKTCKGMMGIVEEGDEVMAEGKKKDETAADLALIGAAQKVEHYEMSGYITARNLAQQLHMAPIVQLLQLSLGEEENADQLLNQVARPLMSGPGCRRAWSSQTPFQRHAQAPGRDEIRDRRLSSGKVPRGERLRNLGLMAELPTRGQSALTGEKACWTPFKPCHCSPSCRL